MFILILIFLVLFYPFFSFFLDPNPGQVQLNPQTGQPDYSIQWAEYYRSLGMHREAEMIEQQAKASKVQELGVPFKINFSRQS